MLSSVGATGRQKRSSVYYEAFSLLIVGFPIGFVSGLLVIALGMKALKSHLDTIVGIFSSGTIDRVALEISGMGIIGTLTLSAVTVWISAYLPARKIGKIGPIECIRGNEGKRIKKCAMNKWAICLFGAEGLLAANCVTREKRKTRGQIGAVAIFMMVMIITSFSTKVLTTIVSHVLSEEEAFSWQMDFDFIASVDMDYRKNPDYEQLKERILSDESVENCIEIYSAPFLGIADKNILSQEYMDTYKKIMDAYSVPAEIQSKSIDRIAPDVNFIGVDDKMLAEIILRSKV